ncbi:hypothetical protein [Nocardia niwae]|uniref:hypothetical protein n=1 Tax=Nocardia niwae TaxID=626084 RepID=UPI0007A45188|nr:hypothetical protein [Nocardia niwae]
MVNYARRRYPKGVMLAVERGAALNWEGDPVNGSVATHQIGPCDLKWLQDSEDNTQGELLMLAAQVTAPSGSDVLATDKIRFNGQLFVIDGQVRETRNSFTGFTAGVRFKIAKDGGSGIRRQ